MLVFGGCVKDGDPYFGPTRHVLVRDLWNIFNTPFRTLTYYNSCSSILLQQQDSADIVTEVKQSRKSTATLENVR